MIRVTKTAFYAAIGPEDIHPRSEPTETIWMDQKTHQMVGRSEPGYLHPGTPQTYWLTERFLTASKRRKPA